jgi:hypothetical protein
VSTFEVVAEAERGELIGDRLGARAELGLGILEAAALRGHVDGMIERVDQVAPCVRERRTVRRDHGRVAQRRDTRLAIVASAQPIGIGLDDEIGKRRDQHALERGIGRRRAAHEVRARRQRSLAHEPVRGAQRHDRAHEQRDHEQRGTADRDRRDRRAGRLARCELAVRVGHLVARGRIDLVVTGERQRRDALDVAHRIGIRRGHHLARHERRIHERALELAARGTADHPVGRGQRRAGGIVVSGLDSRRESGQHMAANHSVMTPGAGVVFQKSRTQSSRLVT